MGVDGKAGFQYLFGAREGVHAVVAAPPPACRDFKRGLWGLSTDRDLPIPSDVLADAVPSKGLSDDKRVFTDPALRISTADAPLRARKEQLATWNDVHGCYSRKKTCA